MDLNGANAPQRSAARPKEVHNEEFDKGGKSNEIYENLEEERDQIPRDQTILSNTDRIILTSRRTKKHVTIHEEASHHYGEISDVEVAVDKLENDFSNGIKEVRKCLMSVASERQSYDLHIKSLEESLRKVTQENEKYKTVMQQMKKDIEIRTAKLEEMKEENESLQSDHESHLNSIADQHRKRLIAKRTIRKWRERLKNDPSGRQIAELLKENQRLKKELEMYEESAKHAFLRSANVLNTEALTLFQNTASRRLNTLSADDISNDESIRGSESSIADHSSSSSTIDSYSGAEKENFERPPNRKDAHRKRVSYSRDSREGVKRTYEYLSDDQHRHARRRDITAPSGAASDSELSKNTKSDYRSKPPVREFLPDHLRQETRQIMSQLEMNKSRNFDKVKNVKEKKIENDQPHTIQHVHVCHCASVQGISSTCSYCTRIPFEKYNCQNLPYAPSSKPKPKPSPRREPCKRDSRRVFEEVAGDKAKVIYKPSGSTVVIQKHLGK